MESLRFTSHPATYFIKRTIAEKEEKLNRSCKQHQFRLMAAHEDNHVDRDVESWAGDPVHGDEHVDREY